MSLLPLIIVTLSRDGVAMSSTQYEIEQACRSRPYSVHVTGLFGRKKYKRHANIQAPQITYKKRKVANVRTRSGIL
jgi:hypothetical protein